MRLIATTLPDDPDALASWLDRHLVGLDLAALIAELTAVHGRVVGPPLAEILGDRSDAVLVQGLEALPPHALKQLLRHPHRLLELQERILVAGGPYWDHLQQQDAALCASVRRDGERLAATIGGLSLSEAPATVSFRPRRAGRWRMALSALASAAAVLVAVYLFREPLARRVVSPAVVEPPRAVAASSAWGWEKLTDPPPGTSASDYLNRLADAAGEWSRKRPGDPASLARRIGEMRQGCSRLIFARHAPLADPDERAWLRRKCRDWAARFDKSLTELEGGRPAGEIRQEMDRTVANVVAVLRERADLLKAG